MKYRNPFAYLRSEKGHLELRVNTIIANTKGDGEKSGEDFLGESEEALLHRANRLYLV